MPSITHSVNEGSMRWARSVNIRLRAASERRLVSCRSASAKMAGQGGLTRRRRAGDNSVRRLASTLVLTWLAALDLGSYRSGQTGLTVNQLGNLRRFESSTAHLRRTQTNVCASRPSSSVVERNLGKIEVTGSIPVSGSWRSLRGVLATARSPANVTPIAVGSCCVWRSGRTYGNRVCPAPPEFGVAIGRVALSRMKEESLQEWPSRSMCGTSRM